MKNCWESNPLERPTFSLLLKQLEHFATRLTQNGIKFEYLTESNCWWFGIKRIEAAVLKNAAPVKN